MPKPPFFSQTYPFSCVPACLRMVLAALKYEISEPELRSLCECDKDGTLPSKAVNAAITCGFDAYQANLTYEELTEFISQNITPIVYMRVSEGVSYSHAVVIYKISKRKIHVLDPENQEREFEISSFVENWSRGLTIIIEKKTL